MRVAGGCRARTHERHQAILDVLREHSMEAWHTNFIDTLESVRGRQRTLQLKVG